VQTASTQSLQLGSIGSPTVHSSWHTAPPPPPQVSPQYCSASPTQVSSHSVVQQYGSMSQTSAAHESHEPSIAEPTSQTSWSQLPLPPPPPPPPPPTPHS
jgi:hypothetical protein